MKCFSFYNAETGEIASHHFETDDPGMVTANVPAGHVLIEGRLDHESQRVDVASGLVVDYQPPAPSADHEWNVEPKRWTLKAAVTAARAADREARRRISALEGASLRAIRECFLAGGIGYAAQRLKEIDEEIIGLRKHLLPKAAP